MIKEPLPRAEVLFYVTIAIEQEFLATAAGFKIAQLLRRLADALIRGDSKQDTSLSATLRDAITACIQIRQQKRCAGVLLANRFPQPSRGIGSIPRRAFPIEISLREH